MAHISPFNGIRFNPHLVPDLSSVVAPPYDVISREEVSSLHARSAYNVTHLTKPDTYSSAAERWRSWRTAGVLIQDPPSMYVYSQTFADPETGATLPARIGLVCALGLEQYDAKGVLPHENTIAAHRADRLELMRATHANFESIYGLYPDDGGKARNLLKQARDDAPVISRVSGVLGSEHTLQRVDDKELFGQLRQALDDKQILIADGHHRYETALAYRREWPSEAGSGAILITLTAFDDEGLIVLPTHRLVRGVLPEQIVNLPDRLRSAGFTLTDLAHAREPLAPGTLGFDMLFSDGRRYRVVLDGGADEAAKRIPGGKSVAWKTLDVTVLHRLVLENFLAVPMDSLASTDQVKYVRDASEAQARVASAEFQAAFLLSRPMISSIRAVSAAGDRMPQKSTYFYPKLLSGLVMRSLV